MSCAEKLKAAAPSHLRHFYIAPVVLQEYYPSCLRWTHTRDLSLHGTSRDRAANMTSDTWKGICYANCPLLSGAIGVCGMKNGHGKLHCGGQSSLVCSIRHARSKLLTRTKGCVASILAPPAHFCTHPVRFTCGLQVIDFNSARGELAFWS